ncbi:MAG: SDR family oxidoreductase [Cyclobacteriaceae bacterium]|nr:SDR family oxidoreductase [Cyclobacteriaceae bacterium]
MAQKNYLIIGGSSGIGKQLTDLLRQNDHHIITASRANADIQFDATTDELNITTLPDTVDGLVYCPGSINLKPFQRLTDQEFTDDFNLHVLGAIRSIRATLPLLKKSPHSSIVLFSTVAVQQGMPFHTSVAVAKGAIEGLTKSLAAELAPGIRVNAIAPSLTNTPLAAKLLSTPEKQRVSADRHPLKRVGEPRDMAEAAEFLLSTRSAWITGQIMHGDGGLSSLRV